MLYDTNIKRCPFCGSIAGLYETDMQGIPRGYCVWCQRIETCGAFVVFDPVKLSATKTKEAWERRRPASEKAKDQLERGYFAHFNPPKDEPLFDRHLRPCPFCGGHLKFIGEPKFTMPDFTEEAGEVHNFRTVICMQCRARVSFTAAETIESKDVVIDCWNRRDGE